MLRKIRWGALVVLLAVSMMLAGCTGGDDRTAMDVLEDMIEQEMTSDYVHSKGSVTLGWESADNMPEAFNMFGDLSEVTINYDVRQSTELARADAVLSVDLGGMSLEVPLIVTETDLFVKIPMFTNDFLRVPLDSMNEQETTEVEADQIKAIILDLANILKDIVNEEWLTLQAAEEYEGTLDRQDLAFVIELELTNDRLQEMLDRLFNEQERFKEWLQNVESIVESQNGSKDVISEDDFSFSEEELHEAKEELQYHFDLTQFELQVAVDQDDHLREIEMDFAGESLKEESAEKTLVRLNHTVISIHEPFEFEQDIPENAVLLEDLFSGFQP